MKSRAAQRFAGLTRSATVAIHDLVQDLRAGGARILDLGGGQPDVATAGHIAAEAAAALEAGFTHYTGSRGLPELLTAIAAKLAKDNGIAVDPRTDVIVTPSAKHALFVSMMTILDPGDEILVPSPGWVSYTSIAHLVGARAVPVELSPTNGFRITRRLLDTCVTDRTRAILVNTPTNPTGNALRREEAEDIAAFAAEHDLFVVADEIYEKIIFAGRKHLSLAALPGCADRTLTVNGFSKSYAMTGWRLGYVAGPTDLIGEAVKVQEHTVSCAASFAQRGGIAALTGGQQFVLDMAQEYGRRRSRTVAALAAMPGVECADPDGTFYAFPDVRGAGFADSAEFAKWLLRTAGVAVVAGTAFGPGGAGHVRISFAAAPAVLDEALDRMAAALADRA
ncbi:pyridoxal phosphate-dependent aminotransferase [Solihabitans fulvus]|uniref:Aminotransferase n=1 Tax=Solihabitans fulvus TaxID=1892852 RepID=A0A5B2XSU9_9PSEU|nr:pyridoxal phosphate-dependent aminotransferase [Solihabitans fulvus]KAA2266433.1 pyridoxal phosphate-dependent aminotransferase [Solihabitans fulvus]